MGGLTFTGPGIPIGGGEPTDPQQAPQTPATPDYLSNSLPTRLKGMLQDPAQAASSLQGALAYGATQNSDQYAKLLKLQKQTGVPPVVSNGNEDQVQQSADVNRLDYDHFVANTPRIAAWASDQDNAAVSGVDDVERLGTIEQHAASMRAMTPAESRKYAYDRFNATLNAKVMEYPLTRMIVDAGAGVSGMAGNIGSFLGWHGDGPTKQNLLQHIEAHLAPENYGQQSNGLDWLGKNVAPMVPAILATGGTSLLARTLGMSPTAAKILAGLTVGGMFDLDQAGKTYTSVAGSGGSDYAARLAANRVAAINAPANALFGATEVTPLLRDNPLLTSVGLGGLTGASGQVGQNVVTGKPWQEGLAGAAAQGAAMQGGMHIGFGAFAGDAVDAAEQTKLRERSPEKFAEAMQTIFAGDQSLRIPAEPFSSYFQSKGMDPAAVAKGLGSTNFPEATLSGGDVEIPPAEFLSKLDPEHQRALLQDLVDPSTGLTPRQHQEGLAELQQWTAGGGAEKLATDTAAADAETAATPEYQEVKEQIRQRYTDAGETPEVAETLATKDANAYSNLARSAGMKPSELLNLYNPKVTIGEAPESAAPGAEAAQPAAKDFDAIAGTLPSNAQSDGGRATSTIVGPAEIPKVDTPDGLKPYDVARVPLDQLHLDPKRFQYKMNVDASGVTNLLKGRPWNDDLAGVVSVWRDPADGKTYVVNGHHRYQLAKETGQPDVAVRVIGADSAAEARAKGALQNIAEGRGTAMDAAKFFRDLEYTPAHLDRLGVSMGEAKASNGMALARLHPLLFDQVVNGQIPEGRAIAIGNATADPAEQEAILKLIDKAEAKGKHVTNETVNELARMVKGAGQHTETQESLFGAQEQTHSLALEKAEVSSYIRKTIGEEQRTFASVSDESKAARLGGVEGQTINAAKNSEIAGNAAVAKELYDRLSVRSGTVDEILNRAAREIAEGKKPNDVKARAYADTRDALREALAGAVGLHDRVAGENQSGPAAGKQGNRDASTASDVLNLFQTRDEDQQPRGWFRVLPDGTYEIGKTKIGDLSTFVHEPAHAYLKILGDLARRDGASETLKSDYQKVLEYLGAKDGEPLTREQQETWARANEQYLREGKAPSTGLKGTFQRFAIWLGSVYKKASDLGVTLSDDIRGVFDRLYAAEDGVNKAEREAGPKLFTSPEEAGFTDEQFKSYAEQNNMSAEQAKADILGRLNEAAVRARSESWRSEEQNVREAVTADVDQRQEYSAIRSLRKGALDDGTELTMSRDDLVKQFGEERVKQLQKLHPGLYRNESGEEPEVVAEVFGYGSAEEMMRAIEAAPRRSSAIETATRDYMTAKHGDIRYDGTLDDQARISLENDTRAAGLHAELTALKQKMAGMSGQRDAVRSIDVAPIASYREAAQQMVEQKTVADLQPTRYLDASRKYSREAFEALQKGDAQAAANAKHKELMNHFLFREATQAKEYIHKFEAYAKRVQKPAAQSKLGLAGGDYRDQFNRILGRYGLGPQVPAGERSLAEWAASEYDQGKEPAIDPNILNEQRTVNYRNTSVAEIRQVHDALINIRKLASLELGMEVNGKRVEFSNAIASMDAQARESLPAKPTRVLKGNATLGEKIADYAQRGDALLMRTERLMEWLDGGKTGPWHDYLWNHAADSQGNEYMLQEKVTKQLGDAIENMPKEQRMKQLDKVQIDGIPETLTRHDLISMAFNMGNDGNLERLQKTFMAHGWDPEAIEHVKAELTPEEWRFVQDGWDSLKPLGQAQAELEKRLTGLPPVMVKPTPLSFRTRLGADVEVDGGYYPVVMDPRYSSRGAQQDAGTTAQNLMEAGYGRAATSRGNMKERTGFGGPLQLDYEQVLTQHTAKVIKDITHREFMLAANKLLLDPQMRLAMRETLGEGYEEKMMPWLRTIVNDRNGSSVQGLGDFSKMMRGLRTNLTLATLAYKVSTSLLQWTHAPRMLLSTKPGSYAQAMVDFLAHPADMTQQIKDLSPNEMAFRGDNLDRDIRETLRSEPGIKRSAARVGNVSIKYTDHILSFPLWLSVYRDALVEHADLTEDKAKDLAMHAADSAVRLGLGSGAPKDLPPIMRNNDLAKLFTMFYSFHNGIYGQVRDIGHQYRQNGGVGKLTYGLALSVLAPAVLSGIVSGNGPKDGENKGLWAAKRALLFGADTVPLLRDVASAIESDGEVKNPLFNMLTKGAKATQEATSESDEKDWKGIGLSYLEVAGDLAGVPGTTQVLKPLRYLNQVDKGKVENPNVWDAIAGSARR